MSGMQLITKKFGLLALFLPGLAAAATLVNPNDTSQQPPPGEYPALTVTITQDDIESGALPLSDIQQQGEQLFATPFNRYDGVGDGPQNLATTSEEGGRPSFIVGNDDIPHPFPLRVNGLDAQACVECHFVGSNGVIPARFLVGGVGGIAAMAMPRATEFDIDDQAGNGFAFFNGRIINPPFVFGSGGIELLAMEMTLELQDIKAKARANPGELFALETHGINFGYIKWDLITATKAVKDEIKAQKEKRFAHNCNPAGTSLVDDELARDKFIGFSAVPKLYADSNDGDKTKALALDTSQVVGVATDLIVRPFGRKGNNVTTRDFDCGALRFHQGVEPVEIFDDVDHDGDGYIDEIGVGPISALAIFNTTTKPPQASPQSVVAAVGAALFDEIGCARCHVPEIATRSAVLNYYFPEFGPGLTLFTPETLYYQVDLSQPSIGFPSNTHGGITVPLHSDLKLHDMGPRLQETLSGQSEEQNRTFITARLWGVADTAPYLHDGRASTLTDAILQHDGEAYAEREAFRVLTDAQRRALLAYLRTLRTPTSL
ncbi:di-heme oxidoredictase family protein [Halioxenophilus sp. WMMB6]|uniref:di-heme oxidoredictase family protein n=1 Tax=Halioxenophilus sp. WMMB6 TaxID=3073815 RepID=UPI00295ECD60|nr:di-heme oxidoredictase family protein [Halioxenophilus sp. WMMB6]